MEQYAGTELQVTNQRPTLPLVFLNTIADASVKEKYMWANITKDDDWNIDIYIHINPKKIVGAIAELFAD